MAHLHPLTTPRLQTTARESVLTLPDHPLVEPSLFYDPPYERPLEDEFAWHLVKYLSPVTSMHYQMPIKTPGASFWVDFVVEDGVRRIGFECGELQDSADPEHVRYRDALVLGSGKLDVLWRFRGLDLLHRLHDCLYLVSQQEKALFSQRGHINLETLASVTARASVFKPPATIMALSYPTGEVSVEDQLFGPHDTTFSTASLIVRRLSRSHPEAWIRDYDRALVHYGIAPEALGQQWAKSA